jgi:capsular polysaccharide biosynthesis protein
MTRRGFIVLAAAVVAAGIVCLVTAVRPVTYTGQIELVVGHGNAPLDPQAPRDARLARALRELVESHVLAAGVIRSMQLDESQDDLLRRIRVDMPEPAVLRIAVDDTHARRAMLTATTTGLVFIRLVESRFSIRGYPDPVRATIWDPARTTRGDRLGHILDNSALAGVIAAIAAVGLLRLPRRRDGADPRDPARLNRSTSREGVPRPPRAGAEVEGRESAV